MKGDRKTANLTVWLCGLAVAAPLLLGGCQEADRVFLSTPINEAAWNTLQESSYSAAEALLSQAGFRLGTDMPVLVGTISEINKIETSSSLGRLISEQVGARMVQAGYDVREVRLSRKISVNDGSFSGNMAGEYFITRDGGDLIPAISAGALVFGTYAVGRDRIFVNLRLAEPGTGKIIAAHSYNLVNNAETRRLLAGDNKRSFFSSEW